MQLSEKKQLYKLYQTLNEKSLTFIPETEFKFLCYYRAHTHFLYLSQKWKETALESHIQSQIVKYSTIQLLNVLDELQNFNEDFQKQLILLSHERIVHLLLKYEILLIPGIQTLILKVISKFQEVLKQYQHILTINRWSAIIINLIIYSLQLGYIEIAQKIAISLYEGLNQQKLTSNREYQVCIELLYYCLRKTENSSYNIDELVEKIKLIETDQNFQPLQKLSVDIHQLNKLIEQQKYEYLSYFFLLLILSYLLWYLWCVKQQFSIQKFLIESIIQKNSKRFYQKALIVHDIFLLREKFQTCVSLDNIFREQ